MSGDHAHTILRRKLTPRAPAPVPEDAGPAGGLVRALSRVLSDTTPLVAGGAVLHRKSASLAELLDTIEPDAFVITLADGGRSGLALLDQAGFATLIEAMTVGRLSPRSPAPRRATATDAALLAGLLDTCLRDLGEGAWHTARPVPDHRLLGILLDEGQFDLIAVTADFVCDPVARPARLMLALPRLSTILPGSEEVRDPAKSWSEALEASVLAAPASLIAELGRVTLPLTEALALGVGSTLTLPLSNLEEVRLVGLDGSFHGHGRLGQTRGNRAVRLTLLPGQSVEPVMQDARPRLREEGGE